MLQRGRQPCRLLQLHVRFGHQGLWPSTTFWSADAGGTQSCYTCAERDTTGLCCPVELSNVLSASFERTDRELLAHLEGAVPHAESCLEDERSTPSIKPPSCC